MLHRLLILSLVVLCCLLLLASVSCTKTNNKPEAELNSVEGPVPPPDVPEDTTLSEGLSFTEYDTPPTPIQNPMPAYPPSYRNTGIQGVVVLDVVVNADGTVGNVTVKKSLLTGVGGLDDAATTAVKSWIFKPALKDNKPVQAKVNIPIPFTLK